MLWWLLLIVIVGFLAYVRFAPSDADKWHKASTFKQLGERHKAGGYIWREAVEGDGKERLGELHQVIMGSPRTERLTGSVEDGQITYISRTQWIGFPDYTTVGVYNDTEDGNVLEINGRLRFGRSDLGVNRNRIQGWLNALE